MAWTKQDLKRSYPCNVELLLDLRERRGWTQAELARASGYTERLISKAESGNSISTYAIETLAETLSIPEEPIYPEDLISDPLKLAKEYIAAQYTHQKNMMSAIRHFLDPDIVLHIGGDPEVFPFAGKHRGIAEMERCFGIFFSMMEAPIDHDHKSCYTYLAKGNEVIVWGETWLHPIGAPMEHPVKITKRLTFRRGKLFQIDDRFDTLDGAKALQNGAADVATEPVFS